MKNSASTVRSSLSKGQLLRLPKGAGIQLHCLSGSLWLTEEADPQDQILETGESARLNRPGTALVMALQDSELTWRRCAASDHAGLALRLPSWLGRPGWTRLPRFAHWS